MAEVALTIFLVKFVLAAAGVAIGGSILAGIPQLIRDIRKDLTER